MPKIMPILFSLRSGLRRLVGTVTALLLVAGAAPDAHAQRLTDHIGYVDLAPTAAWFGGEAHVEVNIKGTLLALVAEAARADDPDFADLLARLDAVQVRAYEQRARGFRSVSERVAAWSDRLAAEGWDTVLRVQDETEHVEMAVRSNDAGIQGMMVMAVTPADGEAVFVNIVGEIDPAEIGRIGRRFRLKALTEL